MVYLLKIGGFSMANCQITHEISGKYLGNIYGTTMVINNGNS